MRYIFEVIKRDNRRLLYNPTGNIYCTEIPCLFDFSGGTLFIMRGNKQFRRSKVSIYAGDPPTARFENLYLGHADDEYEYYEYVFAEDLLVDDKVIIETPAQTPTEKRLCKMLYGISRSIHAFVWAWARRENSSGMNGIELARLERAYYSRHPHKLGEPLSFYLDDFARTWIANG